MLKKPFQKLRRAVSHERGGPAADLIQKSASESPGPIRQVAKPVDGPVSIAVPQVTGSNPSEKVPDAQQRGRGGKEVSEKVPTGTVPQMQMSRYLSWLFRLRTLAKWSWI